MRRRFLTFAALLLVATGAGAPAAAQPGKASAAFRQAQIALQKLGYPPGRVDGRWTRFSADALRRFQAAQGLQSSGRLDRVTSARLAAAANAAIPNPLPSDRPLDLTSLEVAKDAPVQSLFYPTSDPPSIATSSTAAEEEGNRDRPSLAEPHGPPEAKPEATASSRTETAEIIGSGTPAWLVLPIGTIPILLGGGVALRRRRRRVATAIASGANERPASQPDGIGSKTSIEVGAPAGPSGSIQRDDLGVPESSRPAAAPAAAFAESLTASAAFPTALESQTIPTADALPADMSALLRIRAPTAVDASAAPIKLPADISVLAHALSNGIGPRSRPAPAEELPADISILASTMRSAAPPPPSNRQKPTPTAVPGLALKPVVSDRHGPPSEPSPGAALRARIAAREARRREAAAAASAPVTGAKSSFAEHFASRTSTAAERPTRERSQGDRLWIPVDGFVEVAGRELGGLLYVGRSLARADGFGDENCLINPGLSVARSRADREGRLMGYWPAYGAIQPTCRLAYLDWLADGRRDPDIGIGYVFLYLYGLERRAILERSFEDHEDIRTELERLLETYGSHRGFLRYATALIGAIDASGSTRGAEPPLVFESDAGSLPLSVIIAIGRRVAEGRPIEADWMLAWTMSHPETRVRTAARRAFDQLRSLFVARFADRHPDGLVVPPPKAKHRNPVYRAASGTFEVEIGGATDGLPDVWVIQEGIAAGRALLDQCTDELDAYSRLIGRRPEAATTLSAVSLLPRSLRSGAIDAMPKDRLGWFSSFVESGLTVPFAEAYDRVFSAPNEKATPAKLRDLGDVLCRFGIGLIPDPRFPHRSSSSADLKLFDLGTPIETMEPASPGCRAAMLTTALAMLVAKSDGHVSADERVVLLQIASQTEGVTLSERARLIADLDRLEEQAFDLGSLKSKLAAMPLKERRAVGEVCVAVACGDGVRHANEVQLLERIYRDLGLEASDLYASLAGGLPKPDGSTLEDPAPADELVPISLGGRQTRTYSIGSPSGIPERSGAPAAGPAEVRPRVDSARLASIRAETEAVGSVLASVFDIELVNEMAPPPTDHSEDAADESDDRRFPGLDGKRSQLLVKLLERASWPRSEFEALARSFGLMPGGALEDLNDWAYGEFGDVVADDGETIDIHLEHFDSAALQDA